jgi:hypothetical protein
MIIEFTYSFNIDLYSLILAHNYPIFFYLINQ